MTDTTVVSTPCRKCGANEWRYRKRGDRECVPCHVRRQAERRERNRQQPPADHAWTTTLNCPKCGHNNWGVRRDGVTRDCRACRAIKRGKPIPEPIITELRVESVGARDAFDARMRQVKVTDGGCWVAQVGVSSTTGYAYGRVTSGRNTGFHRTVYERFVRPIPEDMHAHHTCFNRACCNPGHIEVMTPSEHSTLHNRLRAQRS